MTPDQTLLNAAASGDRTAVLRALDAGADINARGELERTALCFAVEGGHLGVLDALVERKADLEAKCYADFTALHLAVRDGRVDAVKKLLAAGAPSTERVLNDVLTVASMSVNSSPAIVQLLQDVRLARARPAATAGGTPTERLISAAHDGRLDDVRAALSEGAEVNARDGRGMEALSWAALRGHTEVVKALLVQGASVNGLNGAGWPPLGQASGQGHLDAVRALIAGGADVNLDFDGGKTALLCAFHQRHPKVLEALVAAGAVVGVETLCADAEGGEALSVRAWLSLGAKPDQHNSDGDTPLTLAAKAGHLDVVTVLLDGKAGIDFTDQSQRTALMFAAYQGREPVVNLLLERGADTQRLSGADFSALDYAIKGAELSIAKTLHARGARMGDVASVLSFVCDDGNPELAKLVLAHRPPLDALDGNGFCSLHYAAMKGHRDLAALLLEHGANPRVATEDGRTAASFAEANGHADIVGLLKQHGG